MFNNTEVVHKKYGHGVIVDLEIDPVDELNSKIKVRFDDKTEKKFGLGMFNKFFTTDNDNIVELVDGLIERKRIDEENKKKNTSEKIKKFIVVNNYLKEDWEKAYKVAEEHRFKFEQRSIIMDDEIIFINASDALRYIDANTRKGDEVYATCELSKKHKVFLSHEWRYATKEEIKNIIDNLEEVNDTE